MEMLSNALNETLTLRLITSRSEHRRTPPTLALPEGTQPHVIDTHAGDDDPLPAADALIVTYTAAEGEALSDILTPGLDSRDWTPYRNGWDAIRNLIKGDRAPSLYSKSAGAWALIEIGDTKVVVLKSNLHPATDGANLPIATAWKQWVDQVQPKLVISTGTAGAVQGSTQLGDVVVSGHVSWDCRKQFKNAPFAGEKFASNYQITEATFDKVLPFLEETSQPLPADLLSDNRKPVVWLDGKDGLPAHIVTTDFFCFDDVENSYGLQTFDPGARAVEMDDAAMASAVGEIPWVIIRNASDPQMPKGDSIEAESKAASKIYLEWGQVTSWGSAITSWAACVALAQPPFNTGDE